MKKFTVMYYKMVCLEWYNVEAESEEDAIEKIMETHDEREPDNEYTLKGGDYDAEEQISSYSLSKGDDNG